MSCALTSSHTCVSKSNFLSFTYGGSLYLQMEYILFSSDFNWLSLIFLQEIQCFRSNNITNESASCIHSGIFHCCHTHTKVVSFGIVIVRNLTHHYYVCIVRYLNLRLQTKIMYPLHWQGISQPFLFAF